MFLQGHQQCLGFHQVGVYLAAVSKGTHSLLVGFPVVFDDQVPIMFCGISVAEFDHFTEFPFRVDVHERERYAAGVKRFFGQPHHYRGILADRIEHHRVAEFGSYFADDMDGFGFQRLQMGQVVCFHSVQ